MPNLPPAMPMADPRLGRLPSWDERSRDYPVTRLLGPSKLPTRGRSWWLPRPYLDQGQTPHCVAFAGTHRLKASPIQQKGLSEDSAHELYHEAQQRDEWFGEDYDGTSALGLAKALRALGYIDSYWWCFSLVDILNALAYHGPVLVGWNWLNSMFYPEDNGNLPVDPSSGVAGGHEVMLRGFSVSKKTIRVTNSWGDWGYRGEAFVKWEDVEKLLPGGDACVIKEVRHG